jgi:glycosyltransferase involved in cell wall biosynthesis
MSDNKKSNTNYKVQLFYRKKNPNFFSIEEVFDAVFFILSKKINISIFRLPYYSTNVINIIRNVIYSSINQKNINHITGDIHYLALCLNPKKTILTTHDLESLFQGNRLKRTILKWFWLTIPIKMVKYVTAISQTTKNKILEHVNVNPSKIIVIPNFTFSHFTFSSYTFNIDCPHILQIGVTKNKNIENLARAIHKLNCKLLILGRLNLDQEKILKKLDINYEIFYNLSNKEVAQLYQKSDLVTLISFYEGFGLPIIEAQATGRPVITSNISSMPEVAGDGALLVNPYDVREIKNAILQIINEPTLRERLIKRGLENIKKYHPEVIADMYANLYQKVYEESF